MLLQARDDVRAMLQDVSGKLEAQFEVRQLQTRAFSRNASVAVWARPRLLCGIAPLSCQLPLTAWAPGADAPEGG